MLGRGHAAAMPPKSDLWHCVAQGGPQDPASTAPAVALKQTPGATFTVCPGRISMHSAALAGGMLTGDFMLVTGGAPWALLGGMLVHIRSTLVSLGTLLMCRA